MAKVTFEIVDGHLVIDSAKRQWIIDLDELEDNFPAE